MENNQTTSLSKREYLTANANISWEDARQLFKDNHGTEPTVEELLGYRASLMVLQADSLIKELTA